MKISHTWLQEYFKDTLPSADKLAELFTFHSFEVEGIEEKNGDTVIDAKILPDRAHFCLSYRGIADEVQALTGLSRVEHTIDEHAPEADVSVSVVDARIENADFCRRYVSRRVNNVSITESPEKVKAMLEAVDGRSINTIVDATNLAMFDYNQPLHTFDADKVKGTIVVRAAQEGEVITLLDGREVTLTSDDSVIADDEGPLAIAGVKGGKRAEVTMETKNLIIESANFHPSAVRRTATKYNLRNESSKRFENEITPEFAMDGMVHVSALIKKLSPDATFGPVSDFYPHPAVKTVITTNAEFINKKLGSTISQGKIKVLLEKQSIEVAEKGNDLELTIPFHRLDLMLPEDVVEEVGRLYGYEKIAGTPQKSTASDVPSHPAFYATEYIKNILLTQNFSEAYLYAFTHKGDIEVAYPLASDKKALRTNLSDGMLKTLDMNARNADLLFLDSVKMFEIGKVFTEKGEHNSLCVGIRRVKKVKGQTSNEDIRQLRETLFEKLGVNIVTLCTVDDTGGLIRFKGQQIGTINNIDGIMEINLDAIIPHIEIPAYDTLGFVPAPKVEYKPFSPFPFMVRDIALFVPDEVEAGEIEEIIVENGTDLLIKHRLFDTFKKDGKTSYAFRMIFQSNERTLTDEEINKVMTNISEKMKGKGWEVR